MPLEGHAGFVTAGAAGTFAPPPHARYIERTWYGDRYCDPVYCESEAPDRLSGILRLGVAVSAAHNPLLQNHEVRADAYCTARLNILDHPRLILDQFGFASGRPLGCEAELRLFIFGQEILF